MPVLSYPAEPAPSLLFQHLLLTWNSLLSKSNVSFSSACIIVILMNDRLIISLKAIQAERVGPYPFYRLWKEKQKYNIIIIPLPPGLDVSPFQETWLRGGGGGGLGEGQGGPHLPSPLPCSPSFHLFFLGFLPLALFRLQNIEHCCIVPFPSTSPNSHTLLVHPPSFPFLSSLPYQSGPLLSQTVPPLFSPTALYEITRITTVNYAPLDEMLV